MKGQGSVTAPTSRYDRKVTRCITAKEGGVMGSGNKGLRISPSYARTGNGLLFTESI